MNTETACYGFGCPRHHDCARYDLIETGREDIAKMSTCMDANGNFPDHVPSGTYMPAVRLYPGLEESEAEAMRGPQR